MTVLISTNYREPQSRLDYLESFALLGLDLKITPEDEVKIIEVNGIDTGMKGFAKARVPYEPDSFPIIPKYVINQTKNPGETALTYHLETYGKKQLSYLNAQLKQRKISAERLEDYVELINPFAMQTYNHIVDRLAFLEKTLENKVHVDQLSESIRQFKPRSQVYTPAAIEQIKKGEPEYVVIKPYNGEQGKNISVKKLEEIQEGYNPSFIIEPFVPSKPIYSHETNDYHDGCLRYVVIVEQTKNHAINLFHFNGYWRLSPEPITNYGNENAMKANLSQGAYVERLSPNDQKIVRNAVKSFVPRWYSDIMNDYKRRQQRSA